MYAPDRGPAAIHISSKLLQPAVEKAGLSYRWAGKELGGLRPTHAGSTHPSLPDGLQGYADYMETEAFGAAADQLVTWAAHGRLALMCAERLPQHCHRSLISDYLTLQGIKVVHLIGAGQTQTHCLRASLRCDSGRLVYDRNYQDTLENL